MVIKVDRQSIGFSNIVSRFIDIVYFTKGLKQSIKFLGEDGYDGIRKYLIGQSNEGLNLIDSVRNQSVYQICHYYGKTKSASIPFEEDHTIRISTGKCSMVDNDTRINGDLVIDYYHKKKKYKREVYTLSYSQIQRLNRFYGYHDVNSNYFVIHSYNGSSCQKYYIFNGEWYLERIFKIHNKDYTDKIEQWIQNNNIILDQYITFKSEEDKTALTMMI